LESAPREAIRTERLRLEPADPSHAEGLWAAVESSLDQLRPWLPWTETTSPEDLRLFLERAVADWEGSRQWAFVITETQTREPIGTVGLGHYDFLSGMASLGYWIRTDRSGWGLMTEAASSVIRFGFDRLGLRRIELRAAPENSASVRVAEKVGFKREGLLRSAGRGADAGLYHDHLIFGLLKDEAAEGRKI
jgi:ribosomal-protein-serine acetyltransferase